MNRRILLLSLALLALAGSLGWLLRQRWLEARAHEQAVLNQPARLRTLSPPPSVPVAAPVSPADYVEVAQKTLFSKDRNPNLAVDPPPPPKPDPPLPPLPVYWGQMSFGDPVVILTAAKAPEQKSYRAGDTVGDFKLVAFNDDSITFDWNGKQVERKLLELAPKEPQQAGAPPAALAPAAPAQITNIAPAAPPASTVPPSVGVDMGGGYRGCVAGDNSPSGTEAGGYKKVIAKGLMGNSCHWEPSK
jgi:hypothetical protein